MNDWQRAFITAFGVAAGVSAGLAWVAISLNWYSPRSKAALGDARAFYKSKTDGFAFNFVLVNNSARDYTVRMNVKLSKGQAGKEAQGELSAKPERPISIPAHGSAQFALQANYSCVYNPDQSGPRRNGLGEQRIEQDCFLGWPPAAFCYVVVTNKTALCLDPTSPFFLYMPAK